MTARPTPLMRDGEPLPDALLGQRVTIDQVCQAVRAAGIGDLSTVAAVILESNGSMCVVSTQRVGSWSAFSGVAFEMRP